MTKKIPSQKKPKKEDKLSKSDKFFEYELMDRTSIILENFVKYVEENMYVQKDPTLKRVTEEISSCLLDLYQHFGERFFNTSVTVKTSNDLDEID